ncbi:MAG: PepSY domain-containing protein [Pseudomonadota bacterium]
MMRLLVCLSLLMISPWLVADPFARGTPALELAARDFMRPPQPQGILPNQRGPRVGDKQAAASVRAAYGNHKILSVELIETKGPPVYRVKTLSEAGVVKYVFVDGISGDVFE